MLRSSAGRALPTRPGLRARPCRLREMKRLLCTVSGYSKPQPNTLLHATSCCSLYMAVTESAVCTHIHLAGFVYKLGGGAVQWGGVLAVWWVAEGRDELCSLTGKQILEAYLVGECSVTKCEPPRFGKRCAAGRLGYMGDCNPSAGWLFSSINAA